MDELNPVLPDQNAPIPAAKPWERSWDNSQVDAASPVTSTLPAAKPWERYLVPTLKPWQQQWATPETPEAQADVVEQPSVLGRAWDSLKSFATGEPSQLPAQYTDPQQFDNVLKAQGGDVSAIASNAVEVGKNIASGAINTTASMIKGQGLPGSRDPGAEPVERDIFKDYNDVLPRIPQMSDEEYSAWRRDAMTLITVSSSNPGLNSNNSFDVIVPVLKQADLIRSGKAPAEKMEFKPRPDIQDTSIYKTGQDVEKWGQDAIAPDPEFQKTIAGKVSSGLGSTVPFLTAGIVAGPLSSAIAGMSSSTAESVDRAVAAGATKDQIAEVARQGMFPGATEAVPIELLLERAPLPVAGKLVGAVGRVLQQAAVEGGQEAVQQAWQNIIAKFNYKPDQDVFEGVAEAAGIGSIIGAGMQATTDVASKTPAIEEAQQSDDMPPIPEGFTLDPTIQKTSRLPAEGNTGAAVETVATTDQVPVTQDGSEGLVSPPVYSLPSISPEERAVLRRSAMPDEDIDLMSREEVAAKVAEARNAGININGAMVRAAEQYRPHNAVEPAVAPQVDPASEVVTAPSITQEIPIPQPRPVDEAAISQRMAPQQPVIAPEVLSDLERTVDQSVAEDKAQQVEQAVAPVLPDLQAAVNQSVAAEQPVPAPPAVAPVAMPQQNAQSIPLVYPTAPQQQEQVEVASPVVDVVRPRLSDPSLSLPSISSDRNVAVEQVAGMKGDGTRQDPAYIQNAQHVDAAAQQVNTDPTEAQKIAGNYKKSHIKVAGLDVTLENPKGSIRSGVSTNGASWQVEMPAHYGYIKKTNGADGDQVDAYIGENPASKRIYVVDQKDIATRRFDEHKAILGANSLTEARNLYARAFSDGQGADRIGAITPMSISEFKRWLAESDTTKPLAMGKPKVRTNDKGFPVDLKNNVKKPDSLIEFLSRKGGVREDRGELTALGLRERKAGFVVGAGPLIRRNGMNPDMAHEAAAEAGYLPMESSLADFYDALDQDARTGRTNFSQYDDDHAEAWRNEQGAEERQADEDRSAGEVDPRRGADPDGPIFVRLVDDGYAGRVDDAFSKRVAQLINAGETYEDAIEFAHIEADADFIAAQAAKTGVKSDADIPFFGDENNEVYAGTTPEVGKGDPADGPVGREPQDQGQTDRGRSTSEIRGEGRTEGESGRGREDGERGDREGQSEREGVKPPALVYHGTSNGGFDTFDSYRGSYGLFGNGGYFTEDPSIATEYTRKGKGDAPTVYSAKLDVKNPLDMDAPADVQAWADAFPDYIDQSDLVDIKTPTNENAYRVVEENLSGEMIPMWEGAEMMQDGIIGMGHDSITHIGGGRHKASKGVKHRVWIIFDDEQVSNFKPAETVQPQEPVTVEPGADNKPQLVIPGAERATDADMAQRKADAPLKPKVAQKDVGGLFSDAMDQKDLLDLSASPEGWGEVEAEDRTGLSDADQQKLVSIVRKTAGITPEFMEKISVPAGSKALEAWGQTDASTAAGFYSPMRDVIALALDSAGEKAAQHESFHRLQNLFLTDREHRVLRADEKRLRAMVAKSIAYGPETAAKMSRKEIEAEAYGMWATAKDSDTSPRISAIVRKAWTRVRDMLRRVKSFLNGRGFQTSEDIFGKAKRGDVAKRDKREAGSWDTQYAIAERTPATEPGIKPSDTPSESLGTRISTVLDTASKALATKAKSKGSKFDRSNQDDGETFGDYSTRKIVDYLNPVKLMQDSVGGNLNDLSDAYLTARLAEGTMRHEIHQIDEKYVAPTIEELASVGASLEDLHKFMYAMHAPERNRVVGLRNEEGSDLYKAATDPAIRGASGMSTNEAKAIIQEMAKDRAKFMAIRRAASNIRAMLDDGLKRQLSNGLINKQTYERLTTQWQHYVPLRAESDMDGKGGGMPSKSKGFDVRGDEFKGATGRFTAADNVVVYAVNNAEQSVLRGEKNKAATAALRFINQFDPKGESIAQVYWSDDPDSLGDITKAPPVYKRVLDKDGKVTSRKVNAFQMKDDVLAAKVGGKTYYMEFADPKVGLALKKMTFSELGVALKMVQKVSNWQSLVNTRANPAFIPINFMRDVQTGATLALGKDFSTREIAKMVGNIPKTWGALWRQARGKGGTGEWDVKLQDFISAGGKISFDQYNSIEETMKKLEKDLHRKTSDSKPAAAFRSFIKLVEDLNDTIENGMRLAVFDAAKSRGETSKRAAFMARDLTVDFQKKGEATPSMNALYTFFNASVQGNYNFARGVYKSRKIKVAMGALMTAGFAQHMWNLAMAGDDDDGENAYLKMLRNEPWRFERSMVFFLPDSKKYIMVPLGFGMNAFWNLGTQGAAVTTGDKDFLPAMLDSTRVAFDAFNPLGSGGWVSMALPSIIDPIWELGVNENFSGNPIYPTENKYDPAPPPNSEQGFNRTSPAFRWLAETANWATFGNAQEPGAIDVYPDSLEYLWGWFSGGVGRFTSQTYETAERGFNMEFEPKKTPFVRSFYGEVDDAGKKAEYYREREDIQYVKGKLKEYQEGGDEKSINDFMERNDKKVQAIGIFEQVEKQRKKINKQRRRLEKDTRPQSEIDADMKSLDAQELEVMNAARKRYFETVLKK